MSWSTDLQDTIPEATYLGLQFDDLALGALQVGATDSVKELDGSVILDRKALQTQEITDLAKCRSVQSGVVKGFDRMDWKPPKRSVREVRARKEC